MKKQQGVSGAGVRVVFSFGDVSCSMRCVFFGYCYRARRAWMARVPFCDAFSPPFQCAVWELWRARVSVIRARLYIWRAMRTGPRLTHPVHDDRRDPTRYYGFTKAVFTSNADSTRSLDGSERLQRG